MKVKLQMPWVRDNELSFIVRAGKNEVVIPRSLVDYRRKWVNFAKREHMVDFTLPKWKVEQELLQQYVVD